MHELGIVFEVASRVKAIAQEYKINPEDVAAVVLEVGEASSIVPRYLKECWPAAVDRTEFEEVCLEVEEIVANVRCKMCGCVYQYLKSGRKCPACGEESCTMVTGQEFNIKEILLYEDAE